MKITNEYLNSFKAIYKKVYGEILTDDQAYDLASRLLRLSEILLKPPNHYN
jgi:hypothetical protein